MPDQPARVANMSLGGPGLDPDVQAVIDEVRAAGVIIVAAAGNDGSDELMYPASYVGVISVSAVDLVDSLAPYSSYGPTVDVAAPGGDTFADADGDGVIDGVVSTLANDVRGGLRVPAYASYQGTSMASPHVAGVVALMLAVNPLLTPGDVDALLAGGSLTVDLGDPGRDDLYGFGRIDALAAVSAAIALGGGTPPEAPPYAVTSPRSLKFPAHVVTSWVALGNAGGGLLEIFDVEASEPWVSIAPGVLSGGWMYYEVTVDRTGFAPGTYRPTIDITTSAGVSRVDLVVSVSGATGFGDLGPHYVVLLTAEEEIADVVAAEAHEGAYTFDFVVRPGSYYLVATSDLDNDGFLCDPGESCGIWEDGEGGSLLIVESDRPDLEFPTHPTPSGE